MTSIIVNKRQLPNQDTARVVPTIIYTALMGKFVYSRGDPCGRPFPSAASLTCPLRSITYWNHSFTAYLGS